MIENSGDRDTKEYLEAMFWLGRSDVDNDDATSTSTFNDENPDAVTDAEL